MCFIIVSHSKSSHRYKRESVPTLISQVPRWREGQHDLSIIMAVSERGGASMGQPGSHFPFPSYGFNRPVFHWPRLPSPFPSPHLQGTPHHFCSSLSSIIHRCPPPPPPTPWGILGLLTCTQVQSVTGLGGDFPPSLTRT